MDFQLGVSLRMMRSRLTMCTSNVVNPGLLPWPGMMPPLGGGRPFDPNLFPNLAFTVSSFIAVSARQAFAQKASSRYNVSDLRKVGVSEMQKRPPDIEMLGACYQKDRDAISVLGIIRVIACLVYDVIRRKSPTLGRRSPRVISCCPNQEREQILRRSLHGR
jgi:hypothetical protein